MADIDFSDLIPQADKGVSFDDLIPQKQETSAGFMDIAKGLGTTFVEGAIKQPYQAARQAVFDTWSEALPEFAAANSQDAQKKIEESQKKIDAARPDLQGFAGDVYDATGSFIQSVPAIGAAILTKRPTIGLGLAGGQSGASAYGKYRARGASPEEAAIGAFGEGAVEVGTEMIPMGFLVEKFGKTAAKKFIAEYLVAEGLTEQAATLAQDAIDTAVANPDKTWGEYLAERPDAAYKTALATLISGGAIGGLHTVAERMSSKDQPQETITQTYPPEGQTPPPANLSPEDIASPIPNDLISEGKSLMDELLGETAVAPAPVQPEAPSQQAPSFEPLFDDQGAQIGEVDRLTGEVRRDTPVTPVEAQQAQQAIVEQQGAHAPAVEPVAQPETAAGLFDDLIPKQAPVAEPVVQAEAQTPVAKPRRAWDPDISNRRVMQAGVPMSIGPATIRTKPLPEGAYWRETNESGLSDTLSRSRRISTDNLFVTNDETLAIGQGNNTGVLIKFRGDALSGDLHRKPGTGIVGGNEFVVDATEADAIDEVFIPKDAKQSGLTRVVLKERFDKIDLGNGYLRYVRKGIEPGDLPARIAERKPIPEGATFRPDGKPFQSQAIAKGYITRKGLQNVEPVEVTGGWVLAPVKQSLTTETPARRDLSPEDRAEEAKAYARWIREEIKKPEGSIGWIVQKAERGEQLTPVELDQIRGAAINLKSRPKAPAPKPTKPDDATAIAKKSADLQKKAVEAVEKKQPKPSVSKQAQTEKQAEQSSTDDAQRGKKMADSGEELGYNKRRKGALISSDLDGMNAAEQVKMAVKSKVWERPNYEQLVDGGMSRGAAYALKMVYDGVAARPSKNDAASLAQYVDGVNAIRDIAEAVAASKEFRSTIEKASDAVLNAGDDSKAQMQAVVDMNKALSFLGDRILDRVFPRNEKGERWGTRNPEGNARAISLGGNRLLKTLQFRTPELRKAIKEILEGWPGKKEAWQRQFTISQDRSGEWVARRKQNYQAIYRGASKTEAEDAAREFVKANKQEASFKEPSVSLDHVNRIGEARRTGDVTADDMREAFGFRGVNYGNWMNAADRQQHTNKAYDAFLDLADALGLPPKAMSLNGLLGIAFGAQGSGKFAAHFVPGLNEINITKTAGAGSLAHEWGHALDHAFGVQAGVARMSQPLLSEHASSHRVLQGTEVRREILEAFQDINAAMTRKNYTMSPEEMDEMRAVRLKRSQTEVSRHLGNLRSIVKKDSPEFGRISKKLMNGERGEYVKLGKTNSMVGENVAALRELIQEANGRAPSADQFVWLDTAVNGISFAKDAQEFAKIHTPQRVVPTDYERNAKTLDKGKADGYWASKREMFARAFELYVFDKLSLVQQRNDYLTAAWKTDPDSEFATEAGKRYPQGDERKAINDAFDKLVKTIETRQTDKGVELFQKKVLRDPVAVTFSRKIDKIMDGSLPFSDVPIVARGLPVLDALGYTARPVVMRQAELRKVLQGKHAENMDAEVMKRLPELLADPVGVYASHDDALVHVLDAVDKQGDRVLAVVRPDADVGRNKFHLVLTAYGKQQFSEWLEANAANIKYADDTKSARILRLPQLQSSGTSDTSTAGKLLLKSQLVNDAAAATPAGFERPRKQTSDNGNVGADRPKVNIADLETRLKRAGIADKVAVKLVEQIGESTENTGRFTARRAPDGSIRRLIEVAASSPDPVQTLDHEVIHALRNLGLFAPAEWNVLAREARRDKALIERVRRDYAEVIEEAPGGGGGDDIVIEEAVAELYARDRDTVKTGLLSKAYRAIRTFLERLHNALRGMGFQTADDVFGKVEEGTVGARGAASNEELVTRYQKRSANPPSLIGTDFGQPVASSFDVLADRQLPIFERLRGATSKEAIAESLDRLRTGLQDSMLPLLKTQRAIERQTGQALGKPVDVYQKHELMSGRIGAQMEKLQTEMIEPLILDMHDRGISLDELEAFLYARHAPERNEHIAKINPDFKDDEGSGMSTADALAVMKAAKDSGKFDDLKALAKQVDTIQRQALDTRVKAGLISQAEADQLRTRWKYYVPLRGKAELDPGMTPDRPRKGGSGVNVKGKEYRQAFGRKTRAADILAYTVMQAEESIIRAENNAVAQSFVELAKANKNEDFWQVDKITTKPVLNKATGLVEYRPSSRIAAEDADYTVSAKIDGVEHRVTLNRDNAAAVRLAESMRNLNGKQMNLLVQTMGAFNRFLSTVNTTLNPEFMLTNAFRDLATGAIIANRYDVKGLSKKVLRDYPKALSAAMKGQWKKGSGEWADAYQEYVDAGGRVYFAQIDDINRQRAKVERMIKDADTKVGLKTARQALQLIERVNLGVEQAVRLSAYKNARDAGMSKEDAASLAKNLTVNFNRKGTWGPLLNSLYVFANASIQGNATIISAAANSRKVRAALGGMVLLGALMEMMNQWASDDDEDGQKLYDKIPSHEKSRNLIIMVPGSRKPLKFPLPYGINVFFNFGRHVVEGVNGRDLTDVMSDLGSTAADSFNPIGGNNSILNLLAPSILDPVVDLERNRDFADRPIMPDEKQYGPDVPDAQRYWPSVGPAFKWLTEAMTSATGGDAVQPGMIDVSPETLEYLFDYGLGAFGGFLDRAGNLPAKLADPAAEVTANDIPFARKFIGADPSWYSKSMFYERSDEIAQLKNYHKSYLKTGEREKARQLMAESGALIRLDKMAATTRKQLANIRSQRATAKKQYEEGTLSRAEYGDRLDRLEKLEQTWVTRFNKRYIEALKRESDQNDG